MHAMNVFILLIISLLLWGCGAGSALPIKIHREFRETVVEAIDSGWVDSKYPDEVLIEDWPELYVAKYGGREMRSYVKFPISILDVIVKSRNQRQRKKIQMQGAQIPRNEAYVEVRCNDLPC